MKADDSRQKSVERYHHHFYVNGTMCDLTGRMREAEVRVSISKLFGDYIQIVLTYLDICILLFVVLFLATIHVMLCVSQKSFILPKNYVCLG